MSIIVVALYDHIENARNAIQDLAAQGFSMDQISLIANNVDGNPDINNGEDRASSLSAESADMVRDTAAGAGAVLGGLGGGLIALAIPGIGAVLAAGPIAMAVAGAGLGAASGSLVGALANLGIPEEQAGTYAEGVRRGSVLVTVHTVDGVAGRAVEIMDQYHPVDLDQRSAGWQEEQWPGFDHAGQPLSREELNRERARYGASAPPNPIEDYRGYEMYEPDFRNHYEMTYTDSQYLYDEYEPAYRFGYQLATSNRYRGLDWEELHSKARRDWEQSHRDRQWDDFHGAVREGWATVTGRR